MKRTIIFNGKKFAAKKEKKIASEIIKLKKKKGIIPKFVAILVGDDPASQLYVSLKKKTAERLGVDFEVYPIHERKTGTHLVRLLKSFSFDKNIHGIMVQLPLPKRMDQDKSKILASIDSKKDVDGLNSESDFLPATTKAVLEIIQESPLKGKKNFSATVLGSKGVVGSSVVKELKKIGINVFEIDTGISLVKRKIRQSDLIISVTGIPNLVKSEIVKDGAVVIDVGSPKGDVDPAIATKTSFFTPVPGGVGPVTITCLFENLVQAAYN